MFTYKRSEITINGETKWRYFKNNLITKESTVPHEVKDKLEYAPSVEYDERPEVLKRCIFCDAPESRQRYLNNVLVDLCEWHYQNMTLGSIAHQVNLLSKEQERIRNGIHEGTLRRRTTKGKHKRASRQTAAALN